jgi:curli production assembly/transport component CsgF
MKKFIFCIFCLLPGGVFFGDSPIAASEIVWRPINPSFVGGNPANGTFLLNEAQLQNDKNPPKTQTTSWQEPKNTLNRQISDRLSSELFNAVFGESALKQGRHRVGGFVVDIAKERNGLSVTLTDPKTGGTTTVQVPYD